MTTTAINPPEELLLDYAAGASSPCMSLLVATHLCLSPSGRALHGMLEEVGGALLDSLQGERVERVDAASVLQRADLAGRLPLAASPGRPAAAASVARQQAESKLGCRLPEPLWPYADELVERRRWQRLGPWAKTIRLSVSSEREAAHLLWARAGMRIAEHEHRGREVALVLKGAFWDGRQRVGRGDIMVHGDDDRHAPTIDPAEDCLCLAVTAPDAIHFTGPLGWLFDRLFRL